MGRLHLWRETSTQNISALWGHLDLVKASPHTRTGFAEIQLHSDHWGIDVDMVQWNVVVVDILATSQSP